MSKSSTDYRPGHAAAAAALFAGATVWGLIWYPYRLLEAAGISGALATALTYAVALVLGLVLFPGKLRGVRVDGWLVAIALSAAGCNLGYVLGTVHGEVMRVLLLFYLAPLWTVLLARMLLSERLTRAGAVLVGLSLTGAAIMLWRPDLGAPWPVQSAEWIGLAAGFLFALSNVLIRRAHHYTIELKSMAVFVGVVVVGFGYVALAEPIAVPDVGLGTWALVGAVGVAMLVINVVVQYGLTRITAGRAIVILLSELVVAALGSWWLAGELMTPREWFGGALIVAASLISAKLET
jgi:drug/metabolite transporter (DMT)-like permease